ncbi:O-antigen ligase family protein [Bradyrhizobium manausense]|uniref:O-antigen ligase family protein n=1 Tax=Bradyrhizobium manausense TaxID=989370 RepID=UPI001BA588DD|nr:O-antigen ligase family protein [Bradyrhizobium manausense]MBR0723631.1 O-antigen ligase family protein [Bradyrhizobium manausense]
MTELARESVWGTVNRRLRSPAAWSETVDLFAILTAASLPWSTSLAAIFNVAMLICMVPFLDLRDFLESLKRPICALPIALFVLALVGTLWSGAPWGARLYAVNPTTKLLVLPVLFYHFERSSRGHLVFIAFLVSCALLSVMSWLVFLHPTLSLKPDEPNSRGIFVKNYIDQSQEFTLCAVALAFPIVKLLQQKRVWLAALLGAIALSFFVNMAFVVISRTALVTVPIMLAVFGLLHLKWRSVLIIFAALAVLAVLAWNTSSKLHTTIETFSTQYKLYKEQGIPTSIGLRLEFWRKSLIFFAEAPVVGHGTGSTRGLFEQAATGGAYQASSEVIGNPHNQTLNVAVQWGVIGIIILYAMWGLHLLLFRGDALANWIGLLVVVQNIFTSLFNSHLFDFHEGWMYVLGVGVAGGMVLNSRRAGRSAGEARS